MNWLILSFVFSSTAFAATAYAATARPSPAHESIILERAADSIRISVCKSKSEPKSLADCDKRSVATNLVPASALQRSLRASFLVQTFDKKKPLYDLKLEVLKKNQPENLDRVKKQNEEIQAKFQDIVVFLSGKRGRSESDDLSLERIHQLKSRSLWELPRFRRFGRATIRINEALETRINTILNTPLSVIARHDAGEQPLLQRLSPFIPYSEECRIGTCKDTVTTAAGGTWTLQSRKRDPESGRYFEAWRDDRTGTIWGDRIDRFYSHYDALAFARNKSASPCKMPEGQVSFADAAKQEDLQLPTKSDLEAAIQNGAPLVLKDFKEERLWISATRLLISDPAMHFFGYYGTFHSYLDVRYGDYDVRCISRSN